MERGIRPPIYYRAKDADALLDRDVERILRFDTPIMWDVTQIALQQLGDRERPTSRYREHICILEKGLLAHYSCEKEVALVLEGVSLQPERAQCAYEVSATLGVELAAAAAARDIPELGGRGTLIAAIGGMPYFFSSRSEEIRSSRRSTEQETALSEALLFDFVIGSGQYLASSYLIDSHGMIRSRRHPRAFTYSASRQLSECLSRVSCVVSSAFWDLLNDGLESRSKRALITERLDRLGPGVASAFLDVLTSVVRQKKAMGVSVAVAA